MKPIYRFSLHSCLWMIPMFALWWLSVNSWLLPSLAHPVGWAISQWFEREQVELKVIPTGEWNIYTKILMKEQPKKDKRMLINLQIKAPTVFTVGLPIVWTLLLAMPIPLWLKLRHLLMGSLLLLPTITLSLWLEVFRHVAHLTTGDDVGEIFVSEGLHQAVVPYSEAVIQASLLLLRFSVYMNLLVIPLLIIYFLQRTTILQLLFPKQRDEL